MPTICREALERGASYVIIDNETFYIDERTILVEDSLLTLQQLAKFHRHLNLPIIALTEVTGENNPKLIHAVLSRKYRTKATVGNQ
jgi:UDP-N-acetylmuramoyl-tripeptide--D-alanyl-D-alanine ligase